ncbi:MAG: zinc ribbon domain-containing protein [Halobaculum sp.]
MGDSPRYCSSCGAPLSPGDNFCSACGAAVSDEESHGATDSVRDSRNEPGGTAATDDDRAWLRQRVEDLQMDGWEVTQDAADRVVLVKKSIGSLPVHVLLFLFSGGFLNVLYGWYRWTYGAPKRAVTAAGNEEVLNESSLGSVAVGVALVALLGINLLVTTVALLLNVELVAGIFGLLTLLAVGAGIGVTRDVDTESLSTFGRVRSVETEQVRTPPEPCAACGERVIDGERRSFTDRFYVAGLPVKTNSDGENVYCDDCVARRDAPGDTDIDAELDAMREETGTTESSESRERTTERN